MISSEYEPYFISPGLMQLGIESSYLSSDKHYSTFDNLYNNRFTTYNITNNIPVIIILKVMVSIPARLKAVTEYRPLSLGS